MRDRAKTKVAPVPLRPVRAGLDRLEPALEQLRKGLPDPGRPLDAAGAVRALHRVAGLLRVAVARLAHDDLPALFRGGRDLLRLRHGADAADSAAHDLSSCEDIITMRHIDLMCKVTLATGSIVGYAYGMEFFIAWYSGNPYERSTFMNRAFGPYWWGYWIDDHLQRGRAAVLLVQEGAPEPGRRVHPLDPGEHRHVVRTVRHHRDLVCTAISCRPTGAIISPTWVDICTYIGTFGLFFTLFLLFIRFLPMIAISEVKGVTPQADPHHPLGGAKVKEAITMNAHERHLANLTASIAEFDNGRGRAARGGEGARRRLPPLGRVHAVPGARHGPGDGPEEFEGRLVLFPRRRDRLHHRHADDLVDERLRLPDRRRRQADVQPVLAPSRRPTS